MLEQTQIDGQRKVLDINKLVFEVESETGLSDFGGQQQLDHWNTYLTRAASEMDFTEQGIEIFKASILRIMSNRLRIEEDFKNHPEIFDEDVSDPLIVVGLPRSGTTKMQRMLASVPNAQKLYLWRLLNPGRFPDAAPGEPDPRMAAAGMGSGMGSEAGDAENDGLKAAHALAAGEVEEEFVLFDFVFDQSVRGFGPYGPIFYHDQWAKPGSDRPEDYEAYDYVKKLMQYLQWQDGGRQNRPWIMKSVSHITHLDALMESFPKATVIHCHRDPISALPSLCKLMLELWSTYAAMDKKYVGEKCMQWCRASIDRYMEARGRLQLDDRIIDAPYEDIRDNILPLIHETYTRAGLEWTAEAEQAMQAWEDTNEQGKHGKHVYSLEEFGLDEDEINTAFADYISSYIQR